MGAVGLAIVPADIRHQIKGAVGLSAGDMGQLAGPLIGIVAPGHKLRDHLLHALLAVLQGLQGGPLHKGGAIGGDMALQGADALGQVQRCSGVADAPAGHAVGLGHAVDDDGALVDLRGQGGD